ncbi:MAG: hypothetical protein WA672_10180 [Candidatus Angelobacter sp.]
MFSSKYLRRRVFISHSHGRLHVRIFHERRIGTAIYGLLLFTVAGIMMGSALIAAIRRVGWSMDLAYLLPIPVLLAIAYYVALRITIWNWFGREEIVVEGGQMRWTSTALWFHHELTAAANEIAEVKAVTPWHGRNFVKLTTRGRSQRIGDTMLRDEAIQLAHALKAAVGSR